MASLVDESFEGVGYEETWTEYKGDNSTVDEDSTDVTPPWQGGAQTLKCVTAADGDHTYEAYATRDLGSNKAITYTRFYFQLASEDMADTDSKRIFTLEDGNNDQAVRMMLIQDGTDLKLRGRVYDGAWLTKGTSNAISVDTWYRIEIEYDHTNTTFSWKLDGTEIEEYTLTGSQRTHVRYINCGLQDTTQEHVITAYYDLVAVDDADWVGAPTPLIQSENIAADGDSTVDWDTFGGAGDHYTRLTDDDDNTYVYTNSNGETESFTQHVCLH